MIELDDWINATTIIKETQLIEEFDSPFDITKATSDRRIQIQTILSYTQ